jgi:hypothetical protein
LYASSTKNQRRQFVTTRTLNMQLPPTFAFAYGMVAAAGAAASSNTVHII